MTHLSCQVWVGIFGLIAAVASFRSGWKATALPPPPPPDELASAELSKVAENVAGYDVSGEPM
jgi:hypothetical protein